MDLMVIMGIVLVLMETIMVSMSGERWGRGLKCRDLGFFNHKVKQMNNKNHPEGEKQAGRKKTGAQSNMKLT